MDYVLVTETFPPDVNGVAMTLERLVDGLARRDHRVRVVCPAPRGKRRSMMSTAPRIERIHVLGFPIPWYSQVQCGRPAYGKLVKDWTTNRPDLVHVATEGPLGFSAVCAARKLGIPLFSTFHTNFHQYGDHYGFRFLHRKLVDYGRYFHNKCGLTLVPSQEAIEMLAQVGIRRTALLERGVDTELFNPSRRSPELRKRWGVDPEAPVIICVGRIAVEKNLNLAIRAFRVFRKVDSRATMVLVGDGPSRQKLEEQHPDILFAGVRIGESLAEHYASADHFFFASETETFGNVVTEAMASGLSVLAYDYAAARKHIVDGHSGFTVPFGDEDAFVDRAATIAAAPEALEEIKKNARVAAEAISWSAVVSKFEAHLERFLVGDSVSPVCEGE